MIKLTSARGPSSYSAGGFDVTVGAFEEVSQSSGAMVLAQIASSSYYYASPVSASGNIVTVMVRDLRSAGMEAGAVDMSGLDVLVLTYGY